MKANIFIAEKWRKMNEKWKNEEKRKNEKNEEK